MHVLIFEPDYQGHRLQYVRTMLPGLLGIADRVTVALARDAPQSREFQLHLGELATRVDVDPWMPPVRRGILSGARDRIGLLRQSIRRVRPGHAYLPYADGLAQLLGLPGAWSWTVPPDVELEALMLRGGLGYPSTSARHSLKVESSWRLATRPPWYQLYHLDPIVYGRARERVGDAARRLRLMPDPVEQPAAGGREAVLARYGLPTDGRYVGAAGMMHRHKGVDRLIRAFAQAGLPATDRLLLAGPQEPPIRETLGDVVSLVRDNRILSVDRTLSAQELADLIRVMDVVCVPYARHIGSASIVIRAAAAGRPVLASDFGWCGLVVPRFGLGWTVDAVDISALAASLAPALEGSARFHLSQAAQRFVEFHTPENFSAIWSTGLRRRLGLPPPDGVREWDSVVAHERRRQMVPA